MESQNSNPTKHVPQQVGAGSFVIVDYIAYLRDGTIFDNTVKRGKPVAFQVPIPYPTALSAEQTVKASPLLLLGVRSEACHWLVPVMQDQGPLMGRGRQDMVHYGSINGLWTPRYGSLWIHGLRYTVGLVSCRLERIRS